jgi:predicted phage-related endonuclease
MNPSQIELAITYLARRDELKRLEREVKQLHDRVVDEIFHDQPGRFVIPDMNKALVYEEVESTRFDTAKLKATMPSLYAQLSVEYKYRRLSVEEGGNDRKHED